jgi:hypothetical protein
MVPTLLFQHPVEWWHTLAEPERVALVAVAIGVCTVVAATWVGVRRWWGRWKAEKTDQP